MVVDHQKEEEFNSKKEEIKCQDIRTNSAVYAVEKDKNYSLKAKDVIQTVQ